MHKKKLMDTVISVFVYAQAHILLAEGEKTPTYLRTGQLGYTLNLPVPAIFHCTYLVFLDTRRYNVVSNV